MTPLEEKLEGKLHDIGVRYVTKAQATEGKTDKILFASKETIKRVKHQYTEGGNTFSNHVYDEAQ